MYIFQLKEKTAKHTYVYLGIAKTQRRRQPRDRGFSDVHFIILQVVHIHHDQVISTINFHAPGKMVAQGPQYKKNLPSNNRTSGNFLTFKEYVQHYRLNLD